jgi:hypothetical protein
MDNQLTTGELKKYLENIPDDDQDFIESWSFGFDRNKKRVYIMHHY